LLYLVRWFWWRVTAWCEIVAMVSSFAISVALMVLTKNGVQISTTQQFIVTIGLTSICWLATAFLGPQNDRATLVSFYRKVHPAGPGWGPIAAEAGVVAAEADNMPMALLGWISGCIMIWSALFTVGNILYGRMDYAGGLAVVFAISGFSVISVVRRLWR